jgi:hypothetical protein
MANFTDEERAAILEQSFELLRGDASDTRQISEPESSRDDLLAESMARPIEDRNAQWAARRKAESEARALTEAEALATRETRLEEKLAAVIAAERENAVELVEDALAIFDEEISAPLARQVAALREQVATLEAKIKQLGGGVEPIDLPNVLPARMQ